VNRQKILVAVALATALLLAERPCRAQQPQPSPPRPTLDAALAQLETSLASQPGKFSSQQVDALDKAAEVVQQAAADLGQFNGPRYSGNRAGNVLPALGQLLDAKTRIDRRLDAMLALGPQFVALEPDEKLRDAIRAFLRSTSALIDLSGRLRYLQYDALWAAQSKLSEQPRAQRQFSELVLARGGSIGATMLGELLLEQVPAPAAQEPPRRGILGRLRGRAEAQTRRGEDDLLPKLLGAIVASGASNLLPDLAALVKRKDLPPTNTLALAETIRRLGLPQSPRPGTSDDVPPPAITAKELLPIVQAIDASGLDAATTARRERLVAWLAERNKRGVAEEGFPLGGFVVRPGDWLLMRNPSPYNLFTDLSPGLFTHVGVVAEETGDDGIRRIVLVDLPERGTRMPATNVETYLERSLHYVFVRHKDPAVARRMGRVAASLIGNPTKFDLNFRTDRLRALHGQSLAGKEIHTYCAGLLLLCGQESGAKREALFPLVETAAGGRTVENLAKLGLSVGKDFVSPTGALFSPELTIVGRREPMYDPRREVEEAIFDHFAQQLRAENLVPNSTWFQSLRVKLAEAAKSNPLLAQALARAADVSADIDLVAAARTAAVVEALDEVAFGNSAEMLDSLDAIRNTPEQLKQQGYSAEDVAWLQKLREHHAAFARQWEAQQLTPRQLRVKLVEYYIQNGRREIDEKFFQGEERAKDAGISR